MQKPQKQIKIIEFNFNSNNVVNIPVRCTGLHWAAVPVGIRLHMQFCAWTGIVGHTTFATWTRCRHAMRLW